MALRMSFLILTLVVGASYVILLVILTGHYNSAFGRYLTIAHQLIKSNGTDSVKNNVSNLKTANTLSSYDRHDSRLIVNSHEYKLLVDEPRACYDAAGAPREVFLLVLITTIHAHTEQREAVREMWGSPREVRGKQIVTLFLLAQNKDANLTHMQQVVEESNKHHDLLQEDFQDAYKNLTLKTIMGMKWASTHCPHASFVMKTDDDIYVSYDNLVKHLTNLSTPSKNYAVGCLIRDALPFRDPKSKWYMSKELYPGRMYSPYLSGAGYVVTGDLAGKIYQLSLKLQYLHIEDVFVGECLKSLNIMPMDSSQFTCWKNPGHSYCRLQQMITIHELAPSEMRKMWSDHQHQIKCYNETDLITS
ncbi:beta-1,3-galactosyltransferase 1-like [Patiria miniata]|uniref:Hexosyltransferase n=1 Tax=Patiria miniata TaxID=46514 RepID=A0A914BHX3_PATMI|nr:beta-1,3-galactosyltransferase 1-like [Patiria miniata]